MTATDILVSEFEYKTFFLPKDRKFEGKDALYNKLGNLVKNHSNKND